MVMKSEETSRLPESIILNKHNMYWYFFNKIYTERNIFVLLNLNHNIVALHSSYPNDMIWTSHCINAHLASTFGCLEAEGIKL